MTAISYTLEVKQGDNHHQITLADKKEFDKVNRLCTDQSNVAGSLKSYIMPIRTDRQSWAKDLFLPSFVNSALKVEDTTARVFSSIFAIILDIATLPLRVITLIPRAIYNACTSPKEHPLIPYFKEKGIPEGLQKGMLELTVLERSSKKWTEEGKEKTKSSYDGKAFKCEIIDHEIPFAKPSTVLGQRGGTGTETTP